MSEKEEFILAAIAGGLVGAALGAVLTGKGKHTVISALAGAAIGASLVALKEAKEIDIPVLYEEDGVIYRDFPNGRREVVRQLTKVESNIPQTFSLE